MDAVVLVVIVAESCFEYPLYRTLTGIEDMLM